MYDVCMPKLCKGGRHKDHSTGAKIRGQLCGGNSFLSCLCQVWREYSGHQVLFSEHLYPISHFTISQIEF